MWVMYGMGMGMGDLGVFLSLPVPHARSHGQGRYLGHTERERVRGSGRWAGPGSDRGSLDVPSQVEGTRAINGACSQRRGNGYRAAQAHAQAEQDWGTWGPGRTGPWNDGFLVRLLHSALCAPTQPSKPSRPSPPVQGSS